MMEDWTFVAARAIGTSHEHLNLPCQDFTASALVRDKDGGVVLVAAVSDGAGSAELSQIGSELTCSILMQRATQYLTAHSLDALDRETAVSWLDAIKESIVKRAEVDGRRVRDYACTLLAALVGGNHAVFMQIGDGAIVVSERGDTSWSWVFWPQHGEFANSTFFVTEDRAPEKMEFASVGHAICAFCLFSDGIEPLVLDFGSKTAYQPFFDTMFQPVRQSTAIGFDGSLSQSLEKYLASRLICERTDDDKSLIMAVRKRPPAVVEAAPCQY